MPKIISPGYVGNWHLRSRNEIKVLFFNVKLVIGELGQLPGAEQAIGIHQVRDIDLHVFMFIYMYIKHELDQGPVQTGQRRPA